MTMYPSSSTQQPAAICALKSPADAIHILEAVRLGLVPRVTRRLTGHERSMIRPGTVWVWEEEETNMRRWTDGRRWGASRVGGGGFLVYTESSDSISPPPSRPDSPSYGQQGYYGNGVEGSGSTPPRRPEPLVKQTYSTSMTHPVTGKVKKFHVVAYSSKRNPQGDGANPLPLPHQLPNLANIKITPGIWPDWESRRDEYGSRRAPPTPHSHHSSHVPLPPHHPHSHPHAPPHHPAVTGPSTPVTATAVPFPPPESYRPASPHMAHPPAPPPGHPDARHAGEPTYDRRYPPYYEAYDMHRPPPPPPPPHPYDMYPPQERGYPPPDRYYPPYPPAPSRGHDAPPHAGYPMPPHEYRGYDERYFDRRERDPRDPRELREYPIDPRDPRADPRDDPRGRSPPRSYHPPPPQYYREAYPPREGSYSSRPTSSGRPHSQHGPPQLVVDNRSPELRPPPSELAEPKRMPSWSPHPHQARYPSAEPRAIPPPQIHARQASNSSSHGSISNMRDEPRQLSNELDRDPRGEIREVRPASSRGRSRSPVRVKGEPMASVILPPLRNALGDTKGERVSPRAPDRDVAWGRVPA